MAQEAYQLVGSAAAIYEAQKVPAIFRPLAEATLDAISLGRDDALLDVACGTGIVARTARLRFGSAPRVVGVDLNAGMIATARNLGDEVSKSCEWHVADVTMMPFEPETFSVAICQQGIQFFPDEIAALREIKRVLRPGGRVVLSVWSGPSDLFKALAAALSRHVSEEVGERSLAPFRYSRASAIGSMLTELGYSDVSEQIVSVERVLADPELSIPKEIMASPIGPAVAERGEAIMQSVAADTISTLSSYRRGTALVVPQQSYLFQAMAG